MNQSQKQAKTCGNCKSSKDAPSTSMNNVPDPKKLVCEKNLPIAGVYHDIDEDASNCEGWEPKDGQKE
jgi:hypothetical protein